MPLYWYRFVYGYKMIIIESPVKFGRIDTCALCSRIDANTNGSFVFVCVCVCMLNGYVLHVNTACCLNCMIFLFYFVVSLGKFYFPVISKRNLFAQINSKWFNATSQRAQENFVCEAFCFILLCGFFFLLFIFPHKKWAHTCYAYVKEGTYNDK